jgi:hypothetical protein
VDFLTGKADVGDGGLRKAVLIRNGFSALTIPGNIAALLRSVVFVGDTVSGIAWPALPRFDEPMDRPQKITFAEMRASGVRGILIYCADYRCSHSTAISADRWPDDVRLSDLEQRFTCKACGRRGADVRPDWQSAEAYA